MNKPYLIILTIMMLFSCAPVLRQDLMNRGTFDIRLSEIRENPDLYRGKLLIFGGIIVNTTVTKRGSLIEAIYVPVDSRGYLKGVRVSNGRFLAIYPRDNGLLDPLLFHQKREITLAGEFIETHTGKIDEMEYTYPFFEIKELYLWEEKEDYYYISPPYPLWYYRHLWYDPWWRYY